MAVASTDLQLVTFRQFRERRMRLGLVPEGGGHVVLVRQVAAAGRPAPATIQVFHHIPIRGKLLSDVQQRFNFGEDF